MKDQIQAIYDIANYVDDKCPGMGMFYYLWGTDPYIQLRGVTEATDRKLLEPHVKEIAKPVNLNVSVYVLPPDENDKFEYTCISIGSDLLVWESIFPKRHEIPPYAPIEWLIRQLQEQLFPRATGFTDDLT